MPPFTPSRQDGDLEVGDIVDVPGSMYGTVKFIGKGEILKEQISISILFL
jgi:hypothetical protein